MASEAQARTKVLVRLRRAAELNDETLDSLRDALAEAEYGATEAPSPALAEAESNLRAAMANLESEIAHWNSLIRATSV